VSERALSDALRERGVTADFALDFADTAHKLHKLLTPGDTALIMGAGDIEKIYPHLFH
jgi:UDP-N-acetylmuramate-alanine ligase